jgi:uncharacterized protein
VNCPVCKTVELSIADRQGIEIDFCPQCRGVWLDRGELDKIIERSGAYESRISGGGIPSDERAYEQKRKNDEYVDYDRYDDDYDRDRRHDPRRKKKSFLGEMFDIFD